MSIFTIIVTYNATRNDWISKCLNSLLNSNLKTEIIVIDNNSSDSTIDVIKKNFPKVKLIESKENLGFGRANNLGIKEALKRDGDYVFLLNQDAWIEKNTIEKLVEFATKNSEFGVISPLHLNGNGDGLDYNFSKQISPQFCENLYSDFVLNKVENKIYEADFACAAAWLISKECLKRVGGFNPIFFHYGEDDNYLHRVQYKNLKFGIYPYVKIYHDRQRRTNIDSKNNKSKRINLLKFSNPNFDCSLDKELRILKRKRLKGQILYDRTYINDISELIQFLEKNRLDIINYLALTKENKDYVFLK